MESILLALERLVESVEFREVYLAQAARAQVSRHAIMPDPLADGGLSWKFTLIDAGSTS